MALMVKVRDFWRSVPSKVLQEYLGVSQGITLQEYVEKALLFFTEYATSEPYLNSLEVEYKAEQDEAIRRIEERKRKQQEERDRVTSDPLYRFYHDRTSPGRELHYRFRRKSLPLLGENIVCPKCHGDPPENDEIPCKVCGYHGWVIHVLGYQEIEPVLKLLNKDPHLLLGGPCTDISYSRGEYLNSHGDSVGHRFLVSEEECFEDHPDQLRIDFDATASV